MIGRTLSHYVILEKLGAGGMGVVYKAQDTRLDRFVALKVLPADKVSDPDRRRRFAQEAKSASALNHPNIVTIHDIDEAEGIHFMAMEFVAGKTLDHLIGRKGLPLKDVLNYAVQIADALGKAHAAGIVHRDLKPTNVMVTDDGLVKILDFGLAKLVATSPLSENDAATMSIAALPVTETGKILGTVAYMSPEQAEGKAVDARSDIFSFGTVFYEMLTGRNPFSGETSASTLAAIITREPAPPSDIAGALPVEIERAVLRCLRKEPHRRLQTMSDLKVLLQDLKEESESGMLTAMSVSRMAPAPRKRRLWLPAALAVIGLTAVGAGIAWYLLRQKAEVPAPQVERLTFESGITLDPAISSDGKLVAYASDMAGSLDIYVRQFGSQQSIRRTHHEAHDRFPGFSPDGSKIVFSSERDGGGLYVMDTLVGPEQKISDAGSFPSFSPDGNSILYLAGAPLVGRAKLFLVPATGGTPRPFQPELAVPRSGTTFSAPFWSSDGAYILFEGTRPGDPKSRGWYIAPTAGGDAIRISPPPRRPGSSTRIMVSWRGSYVYYVEGTAIGSMGFFRVPVANDPWRIAGKPEKLSEPAGMLIGASVAADGRAVFALVDPVVNIWSTGLQADKGVTSGQLQAVTTDSVNKLNFGIAANGSKLAYSAFAPPNFSIRIRNLANGQEDQIPGSGSIFSPRLSADGSRVAYSAMSGGKMASLVKEFGTPASRQVCQDCVVQGFFGNQADVLVDYGNKVVKQNIDSSASTLLMDTTGLEIIDMALSPGDRWVAFNFVGPDMKPGLYIAAVGQSPTRQGMWLQLAQDRTFISGLAWSPDCKLLYYVSSRDGFKCVWAQRMTKEGTPEGVPFPVYHAHRVSPSLMLFGSAYIGVTRDRLYMLLVEAKGNLWSIKLNP